LSTAASNGRFNCTDELNAGDCKTGTGLEIALTTSFDFFRFSFAERLADRLRDCAKATLR
jgi:hypothetical protein